MDFVIEIHHEDRFVGGEIRFRISLSIAKSEILVTCATVGYFVGSLVPLTFSCASFRTQLVIFDTHVQTESAQLLRLDQ